MSVRTSLQRLERRVVEEMGAADAPCSCPGCMIVRYHRKGRKLKPVAPAQRRCKGCGRERVIVNVRFVRKPIPDWSRRRDDADDD